MRDGQAALGIELDVLDQEIGIGLTPVPRRARVARGAAEVSPVSLVPVRFLYVTLVSIFLLG